jgi:outer membrane receptor protein involved in Fe transport
MLRKILFALLLISGNVLAQNGSITGVVTDAKTGEAVIGANAVIQGTTVGAATDLEGKFTINNLKPGTYDLAVSFITYKTHVLKAVVVESGSITNLSVALQEDATELQEVVVTGTREINNDLALLSAIKESKLVVSGISAQQIVKLPDNDAAQVMKRVPGITIVDNRFVMVRGVPERYNQVLINNAIAPSTEVDKRSFSFDLISSGAIDQLLIYKSGTPEYPGDFAGGVIQIMTKQTANEEYTSVGFNIGYRTNTTFNDFWTSKTSNTDFLGFDNSLRSLPASFPSTQALKESDPLGALREDAGSSLSNNFGVARTSAPMDYGFNVGMARNFAFGKVQASNVTTLGISKSFQYNNTAIARYGEFDRLPETASDPIYDFKDDNYAEEAKVSLIHNWQFKVGPSHKIEFKNLFVQLGENKTTLRTGTDETSLQGLYSNNSYHYVSRSIYSGQLQGVFKFNEGRDLLNVNFGLNSINRNEPDFRRFRRIYDEDRGAFRMILPPSSNLFDASRFYSELKDLGFSNGVNFEHKFNESSSKRSPSIKAGYYADYKTRQFSTRYFSYLYKNSVFDGSYGYEQSFLPIDQIFARQNLFSSNADGSLNQGFSIEEGTGNADSYEGESLLLAGYVAGNLPLGKFDISGGVRFEYFNQNVTSYNGDSVIVNKVISPLPSLNIGYNITDRSLVRVAYSRTINRPEFRELAPFLFYQFEYNLNIQGKKDLETATIDNVDLRWEMYPNPGESISVGTFYKNFKNPIEFIQENASGNLQFSYQNAPQAYSYGIETEIRKSLASFGVSKFLRNMSLNLNASYIKSEVDMGEGIVFQERRRPLQGQSPYVINTGAYYNDEDNGFSVNVAYNVFGNRIFAAGSTLFPSWVERPRQALDVQISKTFARKFETKLNIQNLLNAPYRLYQDNDENEKINGVDDRIQEYRTGTLFSLSFAWKFMER